MNLFLIRGLPGSGKSTIANLIGHEHFEADMWFDKYNGGQFDASKLGRAHMWCQDMTREAMDRMEHIIAVANTFTTDKELQPYLDMAEECGYVVHIMTVENRHGNKSIHDVPEQTINKMRNRFEVKL